MAVRLLFFSLCVMLVSCGGPLPVLDGIDVESWKKDKDACESVRSGTIARLEAQRSKLLGLSESDVIEVLGRPDRQELYKRHQKFYYYFLEPGKACGLPQDGKKLSIRFNATGASKEIEIK